MLSRLDLRGPASDPAAALRAAAFVPDEPVDAVREIIVAVRADGDDALRRFTREFDGCEIDELRVPPAAIQAALDELEPELRTALERAAERIRGYHEAQGAAQGPVAFAADGVAVEELLRPVDRAGLYVPGGRAAYPSTVLMTAIPAVVAGVGEIALVRASGPGRAGPAGHAGRGRARRGHRGLPGRRRAGDRRARVRHRLDSRGRRHRRPGQHLREHRQA